MASHGGSGGGPRPKLKTSFRVSSSFQPLHTGGKLALSSDQTWLVSTLNDQALVSSFPSTSRIRLLEADTSPVSTLALTPFPASPSDGGYLLTAHKSYSLFFYSLPGLEVKKQVAKAHEAPIITSCADPTGSLFATGSSDGAVKVWDPKGGNCTHVFKGHAGIISALVFDIDQSESGNSKKEQQGKRARLISGADDCKIRVWDLRTRECVWILDGHVSVVRGLDVTHDGRSLVSGGRDKVINWWDLEKGRLRKTVPVFETLEAVGLVKSEEEGEPLKVWSGGDKGVVRVWDVKSGKVVGSADSEEEDGAEGKNHEIVDVIYNPTSSTLTALHIDQNLVTHSLPSLSITRQTIGFNDEVIDLALLSPSPSSSDSHLAVATNSSLLKIYTLDPSASNTTLLSGHSDVVLCLSASPSGNLLVSGSKDKTVRVWRLDEETGSWKCVAKGEGHVESIGAVCCGRKEEEEGRPNFVVTASQDRTAKIWDLSTLPVESDDTTALRSLTTLKIHEKDINSIDIAPNDKLLVTGSQDRLAKLFAITYEGGKKKEGAKAKLNQLGVFKGHKRGIWSVKFSKVDQVLATGSGDRTIKLWSLADFTCLKTFEGHSNSVLRVDFITRGMQLVSCASDGLVKVWNVKDESLVTTLDNHEEKVWALAVRKDEKTIVSGGADSVITFWEDVTEAEERERIEAHETQVLREQDFETYLSLQDYSNAILLALSLDQPRRLLSLFTSVRTNPKPTSSTLIPSITGSPEVDQVIKNLNSLDLKQLLGYIKDWNTVNRSAEVAQGVLYAILKYHSAEKVLRSLKGEEKVVMEEEEEEDEDVEMDDEEKGKTVRRKGKKKVAKEFSAEEVLNALIPYTERHLARADRMVRESFIVEHLLGMMQSWEQDDLV